MAQQKPQYIAPQDALDNYLRATGSGFQIAPEKPPEMTQRQLRSRLVDLERSAHEQAAIQRGEDPNDPFFTHLAEEKADAILARGGAPTMAELQRVEDFRSAAAEGSEFQRAMTAGVGSATGVIGGVAGLLGDNVLASGGDVAEELKQAALAEGGIGAQIGGFAGYFADPTAWATYGALRSRAVAAGLTAPRARVGASVLDEALLGVASELPLAVARGDQDPKLAAAIGGVAGGGFEFAGRGLGIAFKRLLPDQKLPASQNDALQALKEAGYDDQAIARAATEAPQTAPAASADQATQTPPVEPRPARAADTAIPEPPARQAEVDNDLARLADEGVPEPEAKALTSVEPGLPESVTVGGLQKVVGDALAAGQWTARASLSGTRWALESLGDTVLKMRDFAQAMIGQFGRSIRRHVPEMWQKYKAMQARRSDLRARTVRRRSFGGIDPRSRKPDDAPSPRPEEKGIPKTKLNRIKQRERAKVKRDQSLARRARQGNRKAASEYVKSVLPANTPDRGRFLDRVRQADTQAKLDAVMIEAQNQSLDLADRTHRSKSLKSTRKSLSSKAIRAAARNSDYDKDFKAIAEMGVADPRRGPTPAEMKAMRPEQRNAVVRAYNELGGKYKADRSWAQEQVDVNERADSIARQIDESGRKEVEATVGSPQGRAASLLKQLAREVSLQPERLTGRLGTLARKAIYEPLNNAKAAYYKFYRQQMQELEQSLKATGIEMDDPRWMDTKSGPRAAVRELDLSGGKLRMTTGEFWSLLANLDDTTTLDLVERGARITLGSDMVNKVALNADDLEVILEAASEQDWRVVTAIKRVLNTTTKDRLNQAWKKLKGYDLARHDDYFPRMRDTGRQIDQTIGGMDDVLGYRGDPSVEGRPLTKERGESVDAPIVIRDIFTTTDRHFAQAAAITEMAVTRRRVHALLGNSTFKDSVRKYYGQSMLTELDKYVQDVIEDAGLFRRPTGPLNRAFGKLVTNVGVGVLGINPWVVLKQVPSFLNALTEIEPQYLQRGFKEAANPWSSTGKAVRARMREHSPQIWARYELHTARLIGDMTDDPDMIRRTRDLREKTMAGISWADENVIASIWRAAEIKVGQTKPDLSEAAYWQAVNEEADRVIRRTQPNFDPVNSSHIQRAGRTNPWMKMMSMFMSQRNTNYNMLYEAIASGDQKKLAQTLGIVALAQPLMIAMVDEARDTLYGRNEDATVGGIVSELTTDVLANTLSQVYFAGMALDPIARYASNQLTGRREPVFDASTPVLSTANSLMRDTDQMISAAKEGDFKKAGGELVDVVANAAVYAGIPIRSPIRFVEEAVGRINEARQDEGGDLDFDMDDYDFDMGDYDF